MPERRELALRHLATFCAKLLILLILPAQRPGWGAAQRGGAGQQVSTGAPHASGNLIT